MMTSAELNLLKALVRRRLYRIYAVNVMCLILFVSAMCWYGMGPKDASMWYDVFAFVGLLFAVFPVGCILDDGFDSILRDSVITEKDMKRITFFLSEESCQRLLRYFADADSRVGLDDFNYLALRKFIHRVEKDAHLHEQKNKATAYRDMLISKGKE